MSDSETDAEIINELVGNETQSESDDDIHNEKVLNELMEKGQDESDSDSDSGEAKQSAKNEVKIDEVDEERQKKLEEIKREREADAPKTIFVGNLAITVKKNQLLKLFQKYGSIKSVRLRTGGDGKKIIHQKLIKQLPALNGYVVFKKESSAQNSLEENGKLFKGKHIRVNMANEKNYENVKTVLFIGNLKYSATDEDLYEIFSACGEIDYIRTIRNENGCKGIAYVGFKSADAVHLGLELNGTMLDNRPIRVERYVPNKKQKDLKKNKRLEKKARGKVKLPKNNQQLRTQNNHPQDAKKHKSNPKVVQNDKIAKKPKKVFEGKKAERTKKKSKLGQGERQKRALAKRIAPKAGSK